MSTFLIVLLSLLIMLLLAMIHGEYWRRKYATILGASATYYTHTGDGWRLAVHRYPGGRTTPVVLCHGLGANAFNLDLSAQVSLARYLSQSGLDVWNVDLREHGPNASPPPEGHPRWSFTFDDHALEDVPAIIDLVLRQSGAKELHWVGHSLGGMLLYAYLGTTQDSRVASLCTLGSPAGPSWTRARWLTRMILALLARLPLLPVVWLGQLIIPLYGRLPLFFTTHNPRNTDTRTIRLALANLSQPFSRGILRQTLTWLKRRQFCSSDGSVNYGELLSLVRTPALLLAGTADRVVGATSIRAAFESLGSSPKHFRLCGKKTGFKEDYGHADLGIGKNASEEVFPLIASWLIENGAALPLPLETAEEPSLDTPLPSESWLTARGQPTTMKDPHSLSKSEAVWERHFDRLGERYNPHNRNPWDPYLRVRRERYLARRQRQR